MVVVTRDQLEWRRPVGQMLGRLTVENNYLPVRWAPGGVHRWQEAWVWGSSAPGGRHTGVATFTRTDEGVWHLDRAWVAPDARRQGLLREAWTVMTGRYGAFWVYSPSDAMQAFLATRDYRPWPHGNTFWTPVS